MHGGKANSKEEYSGGLQHLPYDNFKHFSKPKRLRTSQPFIQKRPEEGHSTGLPPSLGRWLEESPKEGHFTGFSTSPGCWLEEPLEKDHFTSFSPYLGRWLEESPKEGHFTGFSTSPGCWLEEPLEKGHFPTLSPSLGRRLEESPEEGHSLALSPYLGRWVEKGPEKGHWNALTLSKPTCNLPARTFAKEAEKVAIGRDNYTTCPLPQQPLVDSDESTESENPTSSNKEAVEPDEVRLLARKVYTVLGSVAD
jgi:hypothetical protein